MNCTTTGDNGQPPIPCVEIPQVPDLVCSCPECVRELQFTYNGSPCEDSLAAAGKCLDTEPVPPVADILCTDASDGSTLLEGTYALGDQVVMGSASGACLPDTIACSIASPEGLLAQTFEIDGSCDGGQGLILKENYGAFTSVGFSCDESNQENCLIEVVYDLEVCRERGVPKKSASTSGTLS